MLAAIGAGAFGICRLARSGRDDTFDEYVYVARDRALVATLARLSCLKQPETFRRVVENMNALLALSETAPENGFAANRLGNEVVRDAKRMCEDAKRSRDTDVINTIIDAEDELLGALEQICQNTIRNMLLGRP